MVERGYPQECNVISTRFWAQYHWDYTLSVIQALIHATTTKRFGVAFRGSYCSTRSLQLHVGPGLPRSLEGTSNIEYFPKGVTRHSLLHGLHDGLALGRPARYSLVASSWPGCTLVANQGPTEIPQPEVDSGIKLLFVMPNFPESLFTPFPFKQQRKPHIISHFASLSLCVCVPHPLTLPSRMTTLVSYFPFFMQSSGIILEPRFSRSVNTPSRRSSTKQSCRCWKKGKKASSNLKT